MEVPAARDGKPAGALRFGIVLVGKIEAIVSDGRQRWPTRQRRYITGGKRIGAAVAHAFAAVAWMSRSRFNRSRDEADAVAADVRSLGRRAVIIQADLEAR